MCFEEMHFDMKVVTGFYSETKNVENYIYVS